MQYLYGNWYYFIVTFKPLVSRTQRIQTTAILGCTDHKTEYNGTILRFKIKDLDKKIHI